jgi:hypothetical protein
MKRLALLLAVGGVLAGLYVYAPRAHVKCFGDSCFVIDNDTGKILMEAH